MLYDQKIKCYVLRFNRFKDKVCPADLSLNALLGDEGLQSTGL